MPTPFDNVEDRDVIHRYHRWRAPYLTRPDDDVSLILYVSDAKLKERFFSECPDWDAPRFRAVMDGYFGRDLDIGGGYQQVVKALWMK